MERVVLQCVAILWLSTSVCNAGYSSTAYIKHMYASRHVMRDVVLTYIDAEERRLDEIKRSLSFSIGSEGGEDNVEALNNPINAYHLIRGWHQLHEHIFYDRQNANNLLNAVTKGHVPFPSDMEHDTALKSLVRLVKVYNLSTSDLAQGRIHGYEGPPFANSELFKLAKTAKSSKVYQLAKELLLIVQERGYGDGVERLQVAFELGHVYGLMGDYENAIRLLQSVQQHDTKNIEIKDLLRIYTRKNSTMYQKKGEQGTSALNVMSKSAQEEAAYEALCRGEQLYRDPRVLASLVCRYSPTVIRYARVKEEILSWDPWVSLLYDVISNQDAQYLIDIATPILQRSKVDQGMQGSTKSDIRISEVTWLDDSAARVQRLSDMVSLYTGLNTTFDSTISASEAFQVVNYGIAGQYEPHYDFTDDNEQNHRRSADYLRHSGERLATYMFYLKEPIEGGATVFPNINVTIPPVQNGAAFWYNTQLSGQRDKRTLHAGCPVLLGEKWIANKWIRANSQMFSRPCGLSRDALHER